MKKSVLIYSLIAGTILCVNMVLLVNLFYSNPDFKSNAVLGYAAMVVIFSLIFFGVRNYRNKQLGGYISFAKALKTGVLMALIASTMYVVTWLIYYYNFVPDFIDKYTEYALKNCSPSDLPKQTEEMAEFKEMYKNPFFVVLVTYSEVLPIGLVVSLISAFILKKK